MKTTNKRNLRRDDTLATIRGRVAKIYGLRNLDCDRLDDEELEKLDELSGRVVRVETGARMADTGSLIRQGEERRRATVFVDDMRELMAREEPRLAHSTRLRSSSERMIEFATQNQRVPTKSEVAALAEGRQLPSLSAPAAVSELIDFTTITEEETLMLEQLSAKLAGLTDTHFADIRVAAKIRELAARAERPKPRKMPRRDEPGTVVLPAELFREMAQNEVQFDETLLYMTVPALAALALILAVFADPGSPLLDEHFAWFDKSGQVLHTRSNGMPFPVSVDPDNAVGARWRESIQLLHHHGWLIVGQGEIRLGERTRPLFEQRKEPAPVKEAAAA